jgi:hypothetical protein
MMTVGVKAALASVPTAVGLTGHLWLHSGAAEGVRAPDKEHGGIHG